MKLPGLHILARLKEAAVQTEVRYQAFIEVMGTDACGKQVATGLGFTEAATSGRSQVHSPSTQLVVATLGSYLCNSGISRFVLCLRAQY